VPTRNKRATIREVAEATGLSAAAVSYALRGMHVSAQTEQRVRQAAAELGYEADPIARALAGGRTDLIGLVCGSLDDLWHQQLAAQLGRELLAVQRYTLILDAGSDPVRELGVARKLRDQRVDGLIVSAVVPSTEGWAELASTLPIVSIGDSLAARTAGEVLFNNAAGVTEALEHLRTLGHQRITVLTSTRPSTPDRPADVHVAAEAARLDLDVSVVSAPYRLAEATEVATGVLRQRQRPTALFCLADSIAYGAYAAAAALGLRIPQDLSVAGFDNHPMSQLLSPPLTTFDWDIDGVIKAAVKMMVAAIDGQPRRQRLVRSPRLCERGSTAPPPRRPVRLN
jgi:LacI family transcriptional regulator